MSLSALDVIERLPFEGGTRLESDAYFVDIAVVVADEGNVLAELKRKQAVVTAKSGKRGVAVVVLPVIGDDEDAEVKFGPLRLHLSFQVFELRELNIDPNGTGKSARKVARRIVDVIKSWWPVGLTWAFVPDSPTMIPIRAQDIDGRNMVGYQVNFWTIEGDSEPISQLAMPQIAADYSAAPALFALTSDAGAEIYYTTDDSYPWKGNPVAKLYALPVEIAAGGSTVRACAYPAGTSTLEIFPVEFLNAVASPVQRALVPDTEPNEE